MYSLIAHNQSLNPKQAYHPRNDNTTNSIEIETNTKWNKKCAVTSITLKSEIYKESLNLSISPMNLSLRLRLSIDSDDDADIVADIASPSSIRSTGTTTPQFSGLSSPSRYDISKEDLRIGRWREALSLQWRTLNEASTAIEEEAITFRGPRGLSTTKNRYKDIVPTRFSRVKLVNAPNPSLNKDYINANHILLPSLSQYSYISTQAPIASTIHEFWCMVWEQGIKCISVLSKVVQGEEYWPMEGQLLELGGITVELELGGVAQSEGGEYTEREFIVSWAGESRRVRQLVYKGWKDQCAPCIEGFVVFHRRFRELREEGIPSLVHCSAGIGRSGTLIAVDILLDRLELEEGLFPINPLSLVYEMRQQRRGMVQTYSQYRFLFEVCCHYHNHSSGTSTVISTDIDSTGTGISKTRERSGSRRRKPSSPPPMHRLRKRSVF